jgi:hypothetical protein
MISDRSSTSPVSLTRFGSGHCNDGRDPMEIPISIYIKKNVCLSACLFFFYLDTVRANVIKLCKEYHFVQGKVKTGFPTLPGWVGEISLRLWYNALFTDGWKMLQSFLSSTFTKDTSYYYIPFSHAGCECISESGRVRAKNHSLLINPHI